MTSGRSGYRSKVAGRTKTNHEAAESLRLLVASVRDYAIFTVDLGGRISSWHIGAQLMKGYTSEEAIGGGVWRDDGGETEGPEGQAVEGGEVFGQIKGGDGGGAGEHAGFGEGHAGQGAVKADKVSFQWIAGCHFPGLSFFAEISGSMSALRPEANSLQLSAMRAARARPLRVSE